MKRNIFMKLESPAVSVRRDGDDFTISFDAQCVPSPRSMFPVRVRIITSLPNARILLRDARLGIRALKDTPIPQFRNAAHLLASYHYNVSRLSRKSKK